MTYEGYTIDKHEGAYRVRFADKVVSIGLPSEKAAKEAVNNRVSRRRRLNLAPDG